MPLALVPPTMSTRVPAFPGAWIRPWQQPVFVSDEDAPCHGDRASEVWFRVVWFGKTLFKFGERGEVVGREDLPVYDREIDLELIKPTGMDGTVGEDRVGPFGGEAVDSFLAPVSAARRSSARRKIESRKSW
jgi:hypothetical protein